MLTFATAAVRCLPFGAFCLSVPQDQCAAVHTRQQLARLWQVLH